MFSRTTRKPEHNEKGALPWPNGGYQLGAGVCEGYGSGPVTRANDQRAAGSGVSPTLNSALSCGDVERTSNVACLEANAWWLSSRLGSRKRHAFGQVWSRAPRRSFPTVSEASLNFWRSG